MFSKRTIFYGLQNFESYLRIISEDKFLKIEISSPKNDRKNQSVPKLEIDFYETYVIPLFQSVFRIFPELEACLDVVKENLSKWKEAYEEELKKKELEKIRFVKEREKLEEEEVVDISD